MPKFQDLSGQKFNYLKVIEHAGRNHIGKHMYLCKCDCGKTVIVRGEDIKSGNTKSCGCMRRQMTIDKNFKHGFAHTPMYNVWSEIKERCLNPNNKSYKNYGGRGIVMCEEWLDYMNFHRDMVSTYREGLTIERVGNDKGYSKSNCIWADINVQANNKRKNHFIEYAGERLTISQMARKHNMKPYIVQKRIYKGWSVEKALTTPVDNALTYTANGITGTLPYIADCHDVKYDSLRWYINKGKPIEEALKLATKK